MLGPAPPLLLPLLPLLVGVGTFVAMELYSALAHRLLWHGPLWALHKSHHATRPGGAAEEGFVRNDLLSLAHAPVAVALIAASFFLRDGLWQISLGVGAGMSGFGALYFVFHDGMVHGRLNVGPRLLRFRLCRAWQAAHLAHHRRPGGPFGFFLSPLVLRSPPPPPPPSPPSPDEARP